MLICAVIPLLFGGLQTDRPTPQQIMDRATASAKSLSGIQYTVEIESGTTALIGTVAKRGGASQEVFVNAQVLKGSEAGKKFVFASDGKLSRYALGNGEVRSSAGEKSAIASLPEGAGLFLAQTPPPPNEFVNATAQGVEEVSGRACDVLEIARKPEGRERWSFDRNTGLPLKLSSKELSWTILSLDVGKALPPVLFTLSGTDWRYFAGMDEHDWKLLKPGQPAPEFSLKDSSGRALSLESLRGKLVLIDFWATWCAPCIAAMPHLKELNAQYKDKGLVVVSVTTRDPKGDPVAFMRKKGYTWRMVPKGDAAADAFRVHAVPTLYLLDEEGKIIFRETGLSESTKEVLDGLLKRRLSR